MLSKVRSHVCSDRRKRFLLKLAPLLVLLAATPALAVASHGPSDNPARDFAVGHGTAAFEFEFTISARSGPSGEDPGGEMAWTALPFGRITGEVTCFVTVGNRAVVGTPEPFGPGPGDFFIWVEDNGPGRAMPDEVAFNTFGGGFGSPTQADCLAMLAMTPSGMPLESGNVIVHDGQP